METSNFTNGFEFTVPSTVQTVFYDSTTSAEVGQDFVLPDYQPEMRKLLRVTPSIQPPSRFLGVGEAEFAGNISFHVLYIGGDGGLYTADLAAPYTFRVPTEGDDRMSGDRPLCLGAEMAAESVIPRLIAPRKLQIKCRLSAHIVGLCDEETDVRGDRELIGERLEQTVLSSRAATAVGEALELTDEFPVPAGEGEPRLIGTEGTVQITEAIPAEGGVSCRGELHLKLLLTRDRALSVSAEEGAQMSELSPTVDRELLETVTRRIPFTQTIEMPISAEREGYEAIAYGCCTDISVRVEDDRLLCAATVVAEAQMQGNEKSTFVRDCYATTRPTACVMRPYTYRRALCCVNGNVTSGGPVPSAQAGIPQGITPIDLSGSAVLTGVSCERGHIVLTGDALYRLLYRTAEGEIGHTEFHLPLRYELPDSGTVCDEGLDADARAVMLSGRIRPEGEEGYTVDAEWAIAARIFAQQTAEAVDEVHPDGEATPPEGAYILCYPAPGESLWSVAKRYRTPLRALASLNDLPGAADPASPLSLDGVKYLMIG